MLPTKGFFPFWVLGSLLAAASCLLSPSPASAQPPVVILPHRPPPPGIIVYPGRPRPRVFVPVFFPLPLAVYHSERRAPVLLVPRAAPMDAAFAPELPLENPEPRGWNLPGQKAGAAGVEPPPPPAPFGQVPGPPELKHVELPRPLDPRRQLRAERSVAAGDRVFRTRIYSRAAEDYAAATRQNPSSAEAYFKLALANFAMTRFAKAAEAIRRGISADPAALEHDFRPSDLYADRDRFDGHLSGLRAYLFQNPTDVDARLVEGFVQFFSGERAKALEAFRSIQDDPANQFTARRFLRLLAEAPAE